MRWPSSKRVTIGISIAICVLLANFAEGVKLRKKKTHRPRVQTIAENDRIQEKSVDIPESTLKGAEEEKNNSLATDDFLKESSIDISKGFDKDNPEVMAKQNPEILGKSDNQIVSKKPLRAELVEFSNKDDFTELADERSPISMEILERVKALHQEIENLKKMQITASNDPNKFNGISNGGDGEIIKDSSLDDKNDEELLADIQKAQAENSKRKWIPQTPMAKEAESNFWGWIIGISIILIFLAFGATFIAIRTYW